MKRDSLGFVLVMSTLFLLAFVGFVKANHLDGRIGVRVRTDEVNLSLQVPVALARLALAFAPGEVYREAGSEVDRWGPAARAAVDGLGRCPDAELVRVETPHERVRVEKRGGTLVVHVQSRTEEVQVEVPTSLVASVLERIEDRAGSRRASL